MSTSQRNIYIGITVAFVALIAFVLFKDSSNITNHSTGTNTNTTTTTDDFVSHEDDVYGFRISYPAHSRAFPIDAKGTNDDRSPDAGVSFAEKEDVPGIMGVKIYTDVPYQSTEEWLANQNRERENLRKERSVQIDGYEALVTYKVSVMPEFEEKFLNEKRTVFLKDGDLYEIWTQSYGDANLHEKAWASFRFDPSLIRE